jgi:hypothetical protein
MRPDGQLTYYIADRTAPSAHKDVIVVKTIIVTGGIFAHCRSPEIVLSAALASDTTAGSLIFLTSLPLSPRIGYEVRKLLHASSHRVALKETYR